MKISFLIRAELWYNSRKAAITLAFQPFFPPLAGQPKNRAHYTIPLMLPGIMSES
ncbi:hypothetical protein HMPREF0239_03460 [Clostridium sp. ATCC BAA-442]|uniref:Uncharacterized protein n=1 Tax=Flavonifractor plautii ATCC 29863 TaxID=411475 RepID=G9YQ00_FLAPL|nr:hypothetical protein HMPREF0372_01593 [Flavonifractor plautii ATCC 29863]ERI70856.1 hypothetical protein HMPREF0239_03460 [Clostridium sp. ATCC BAA-442]